MLHPSLLPLKGASDTHCSPLPPFWVHGPAPTPRAGLDHPLGIGAQFSTTQQSLELTQCQYFITSIFHYSILGSLMLVRTFGPPNKTIILAKIILKMKGSNHRIIPNWWVSVLNPTRQPEPQRHTHNHTTTHPRAQGKDYRKR